MQLWEPDCKEGRAPNNWCLQTVVLGKTPESPLDSREIKPVNLKGNQPWIHFGRTNAEAEAPVFWSTDANSWLIRKVPDAGKRLRAEEEGVREWDAGWHHRCNGHELGQTSGDDEGQGGLACCSPWGRKELSTTGWLNNNKKQLMGLCDRALYDLWNLEYFLSGIFQKSFANIWCKWWTWCG